MRHIKYFFIGAVIVSVVVLFIWGVSDIAEKYSVAFLYTIVGSVVIWLCWYIGKSISNFNSFDNYDDRDE